MVNGTCYCQFVFLCQMFIQYFFSIGVVFCDKCYVTVVMAFIVADVIPLWQMKPHYYDWCYCHIDVRPFLKCYVTSDITSANVNGWCYYHCGWCYCHHCFLLCCGRCNNHLLLADVIAKCVMADVIAKYVMADGVAICGRWNSHFMWWVDVIALW